MNHHSTSVQFLPLIPAKGGWRNVRLYTLLSTQFRLKKNKAIKNDENTPV